MASARLTCGQHPSQTPSAQVSSKREDLTCEVVQVIALDPADVTSLGVRASMAAASTGRRLPNGTAAWTWRSVPEPALGSLTPGAREWEMTRYRAYQAQLAGQPVGATFRHATAFLRLAAEGSSLSRT